MTCRKSRILEEIDDLSDMVQVMAALGISCKGLQTMDEMKSRVKTEFNQSEEKPAWTAGKVRTIQIEYIKNSFKAGNVWFAMWYRKPFNNASYSDSDSNEIICHGKKTSVHRTENEG